ncbi:hypothetical protein [Methylogaea oryzae]|uniref:Uncharacterized protein n=1 Tax=Methylogaea oryzae TaxID=1295382 RepID=A0A8D4VPX7_9GAMM|nr:hypothetical protein [Methylogaea oryzae]BBL71087.1 hypothetical protein MoryE10_16930 [Methylogaea oryzae]
MIRRYLPLLLGLLAVFPTHARPLSPDQVPEPLRTWIPWVLQGHEQSRCPFLFDDHATALCAWPGPLDLRLDAHGGAFRLNWQVYAAGPVPLPGESRYWPLSLQVDGKPAAVLERDGMPVVELAPGGHVITGQFAWEALPDSLPVPGELALLSLQVEKQTVAEVQRDADGRVWLRDDGGEQAAEIDEPLRLQVFRQWDDATPQLLSTRLLLDVSGQARELLLSNPLPQGLLPLAVTGELPARLEPDGALRLQLRPGHWQVDLTARSTTALDGVNRPPAAAPWPQDEVWSFLARTDQRLVEVSGAAPLDPSQANVPDDWRALPAYRVENGGGLKFRTVRRGDPEPEPDALSLQRQLWLDFDGGGYTASDSVSGSLSRAWRLEAGDDFQLGRASVNGQPHLITLLAGGRRPGVEVRHGNLNLSADGRVTGDIRRLSATGWAQDFQRASVDLHLPPGWRLLAAAGVDNVPDTWLDSWTLRDLFLVLILALVVGRLWGKPWGMAALAALALLWQEPAAPQYVWLHLLAAIALLRVLPDGVIRRAARFYRNLSWLALAVVALPFMAEQLRQGIYPQLERPWQAPVAAPTSAPMAPAPAEQALEEGMAGGAADLAVSRSMAFSAPKKAERKPLAYSAEPPGFDPKARVQTGPGLPDWHWRTAHLAWNGPVAQGQTLRLYLLPPAGTLLCNWLRVALLLLLAARLADLPMKWRPGMPPILRSTVPWLLPLLLALAPPAGAGLPDDARLEQLSQRLLEAPECLPRCADLAVLRLEAGRERLALLLEWHAAATVAVPLPAVADEWLPETVKVDGNPAQGVLKREDGGLWLSLPAGVHAVELEGRAPAADSVRLPLIARPHRAVVRAQGWQVEGVRADGQVDSQLRLLRQDTEVQSSLRPAPLPPFVRLERTLELGLDWRVHNRLSRLSPLGAPIGLDIPLLAGESVTTAGVAVAQGKASVSLLPQQSQLEWESVLEQRPELSLTASSGTAWHEVWELRASPVWHVEWQGIAPVHRRGADGVWAPQWYPWPGESVALQIARPEGVAGPTLTIDGSQWHLVPGADFSDSRLQLTLRSSLGGQHKLNLPENARLQRALIDGVIQPVRAQGREVALPLRPGVQQVTLEWREGAGIGNFYRFPALDLGSDSVNSRLDLQLGLDRWLLLVGGPLLGPAVLFWGLLLVLVVVAAGLGRIPWTPLRARHWLLLLLGFSQSSVYAGLLMVGWLLALGRRGRRPVGADRWFNWRQVALGVFTLAAMIVLFDAVSQGLLGRPDMQVAGNGSTAQSLHWYQDRSGPSLSRPWVISLPLPAYRGAMLAWALWLAWALLDWLRWGWTCYGSGGLWRAKSKAAEAGGAEKPSPSGTAQPSQPSDR